MPAPSLLGTLLLNMEDRNALPEMPESGAGGRGQMLESLASMLWTIVFLAYSSSTFLSEFGTGTSALWTVGLVAAPSVLASLHPVLDGERGAAKGALATSFEIMLGSPVRWSCMFCVWQSSPDVSLHGGFHIVVCLAKQREGTSSMYLPRRYAYCTCLDRNNFETSRRS